ncbi:putative ABC transport system substrate-binding protein [Desulfovibrionales bacterium]
MKHLFLACMFAGLLIARISYAQNFTISVSQIVEHPALDATRKGFMDALKDAGVDVIYHVHNAQGNISTANQIASQIKDEKPDLVLAIATSAAQACAQKIKDVPILISAVTDPVDAGLVKTLEAPGGNVTGMTDMLPVDRHVELIQEFVPDIKAIGVLYNAGEANSVTLLALFKQETAKRGLIVETATVASSGGIYQAIKSLVGHVQAFYVPTDNTVLSALESVIKVANEARIPLFSGDTDSVERGSLASLGFDYYNMGRQTGEMARRILIEKVSSATMPIEKLKKLNLIVNMRAATAISKTIPESVARRADKIIE